MKERIVALLGAEKISPAKFAEILGVQRSGISHILSGRNQPSLDMLTKILNHFPNISAEWLLRGQGAIYHEPSDSVIPERIELPKIAASVPDPADITDIPEIPVIPRETVLENPTHATPAERIVIFYPDHTFEIFNQR